MGLEANPNASCGRGVSGANDSETGRLRRRSEATGEKEFQSLRLHFPKSILIRLGASDAVRVGQHVQTMHCACSKRRSPRGSQYLVKEGTEVKFTGENLLAAQVKVLISSAVNSLVMKPEYRYHPPKPWSKLPKF